MLQFSVDVSGHIDTCHHCIDWNPLWLHIVCVCVPSAFLKDNSHLLTTIPYSPRESLMEMLQKQSQAKKLVRQQTFTSVRLIYR